jgi:hypothetical protein
MSSNSKYGKMNIQAVENNSSTIIVNESVQEPTTCILDESTNTLKKRAKKKSIPFWGVNPNVLLDSSSVFEFFPVESMTYEQKLNAISRTVILLTLITFLYTKSYRLLAICTFSLLAICLLFYAHQRTSVNEGFGEDDEKIVAQFLDEEGRPEHFAETFVEPTSQNPLSNVLLPEYEYDPTRKPAPPATNPKVDSDILKQAKKMVQEANPGQPDIAKKLFTDLSDELEFEQSLQPFYSTANTMIPNDQGAFAEFCYGGMISCKEGNMFACDRNDMSRYNNY